MGLQAPKRGFLRTGAEIVKRETALGLYKGLGAVLTGIVPKMAIRFTSYEWYKQLLADKDGMVSSKSTFMGKCNPLSASENVDQTFERTIRDLKLCASTATDLIQLVSLLVSPRLSSSSLPWKSSRFVYKHNTTLWPIRSTCPSTETQHMLYTQC